MIRPPKPKSEKDSENETVSVVLGLLLYGTAVLCLVSCTSYPHVPDSGQAGWDGNEQTSGIVSFDKDGITVSKLAVDSYNDYIKTFGNIFHPPIQQGYGVAQVGGKFRMTYEALDKWKKMIDRETEIKLNTPNAPSK